MSDNNNQAADDRHAAAPQRLDETRPKEPMQASRRRHHRRVEKQRLAEKMISDEVLQYYLNHTKNSHYNRLYHVVTDEPYNMYIVRFYKSSVDEHSISIEKECSRLYFIWDGIEVKSYDESYRWLQDFIRHSKERRVKSSWNFLTSPLTIGGLIGVMLVVVVAIVLFLGQHVPNELWQVLTAVIAFYFGKGSTGSGQSAEHD